METNSILQTRWVKTINLKNRVSMIQNILQAEPQMVVHQPILIMFMELGESIDFMINERHFQG